MKGATLVSVDELRELVLELEGAVERAHMGHPDFRVNGRIFASLHASEQWGTVKLTPEEQREFIRTHPGVFAPAAGAWGRQGWTTVQLNVARRGEVRSALLLAWQAALNKPASRRRSLPKAKK
jgi:YjbR